MGTWKPTLIDADFKVVVEAEPDFYYASSLDGKRKRVENTKKIVEQLKNVTAKIECYNERYACPVCGQNGNEPTDFDCEHYIETLEVKK